MEKSIRCAECGREVIYNEIPGYPRKYCKECSEKKKAEFRGEDAKPEVVSVPQKTVQKDNGFHLTPEKINLGALRCAVEFYKDSTNATVSDILDKAERFKKYIVTGE